MYQFRAPNLKESSDLGLLLFSYIHSFSSHVETQTVLSVFWVPRCGPQKPRLFWPAYPHLRTAPHQEKVARSQRSTDEYLQGTLHLLLQIQLSPRKSAAFLALGT